MSFEAAFARAIGHEGGYVLDLKDPGGETKYGISARSYPKEDIAGLTLERAMAIYRRDYWDRCRCDELPEIVALAVFDAAINSGVDAGIRWMQSAAGVAADGRIGPVTMEAVWRWQPAAIVARMEGHRLLHMTDLSHWTRFGRGWGRRVGKELLAVPLEAVEEGAPPGTGWVERAPPTLGEVLTWLVEHPAFAAAARRP